LIERGDQVVESIGTQLNYIGIEIQIEEKNRRSRKMRDGKGEEMVNDVSRREGRSLIASSGNYANLQKGRRPHETLCYRQ